MVIFLMKKTASILNRAEGKPDNTFSKDKFDYDPIDDCFICPNDRKLSCGVFR
jgi:hypothetical protein